MPVKYLKTLTPTRIKVYSLPKVQLKPRAGGIEKDIVRAFNINLDWSTQEGGRLWDVNFGIKNNGHYAIKNIKVFFLYKKSDEIVSYSSEVYDTQILPKLALQFRHHHNVRYFRGGTVEIRILDYEIDRSVGSSPVDLLFK